MGALSSDWHGANSFAFPPPAEMPSVVQYLAENPDVSATVVAPYWPAQPWFQQLVEHADHVEVAPLSQWAQAPPWLHGSARHALAGATLCCARVLGRPPGVTQRGRQRAADR